MAFNQNKKKAVIKYCLTKNIRIISSMGTGNRIDPSKLEIIDIKKNPFQRIFFVYSAKNPEVQLVK